MARLETRFSLDLDKLAPEQIKITKETPRLVDASADAMRDRSNCRMAYAPSITAR